MLLVFSIIGIILQLFSGSFGPLSLIGLILTIFLLVFTKQGLDALENERAEMKQEEIQPQSYTSDFQKEELKKELREELKAEIIKEMKEGSKE